MSPQRPEPMQAVKERRDRMLSALIETMPYSRFLGVTFERRGDELTAVLRYSEDLIGNPHLPALHGGATAAFLELTAITGLTWSALWPRIEAGDMAPEDIGFAGKLRLPKTIDFTVDYLRSGLPRDAYARAQVTRAGRRYASVRVEAWQDNVARPFAQATGHFLIPGGDD
jgi:acyl-coenzyme A thioesterase PaaI-like protein